MTGLIRLSAGLALAALLFGCDSGVEEAPKTPDAAQVELSDEQKQQLSQNTRAAWLLAEPAIKHTLDSAQKLLGGVEKFLREPTVGHLKTAQAQWRQTALDYQPLAPYSQLAESHPEQFPRLRQLLYDIAAHPIQPGYLDSFGPYPYSGLVHNISLPITVPTLRKQHGLTSEQDATLGLYAMHFILFGEKQSRKAADFTPQQLTAEDRARGFTSADELPRNRRRQLLRIQAQLLVEDLQRLHTLWRPQAEASLYPVFMDQPPLQRYQLLRHNTQLGLSQILLELNKTPANFLAARLQTIGELAKILNLGEELQKSSQQARQALAKADADAAAKALTHALDLMTRGKGKAAD